MTAVRDAFRQARLHAVRHMAACEGASLRWSEVSITEIVTAHAAQAVQVVPFTQRAEALSGADWVWWWIDGTSAYGMLVQAKRLTATVNQWNFDFGYRTKSTGRAQRDTLMSVAKALDLLPVYALYLGTAEYRRHERCSGEHRSGRCLECQKRSVSLMPALLASDLIISDAGSTYEFSVSLEDLWTQRAGEVPLSKLLQGQMGSDLSDFLRTPQQGTRAITRAMMDRILKARMGAFSAPPVTAHNLHLGEHDRLGPVFIQVPDDTGHFGLPYFDHVLRPLRHAPPDYVLEIMTKDVNEADLAAAMPDSVAGVVVVQVPRAG